MAQLGQALCDGQENWLSAASGAAQFGTDSTNQQHFGNSRGRFPNESRGAQSLVK